MSLLKFETNENIEGFHSFVRNIKSNEKRLFWIKSSVFFWNLTSLIFATMWFFSTTPQQSFLNSDPEQAFSA
jgi:hypothetical protein